VDLIVITVIAAIGGAYCFYRDSGVRGTYCIYCDSGDRVRLL